MSTLRMIIISIETQTMVEINSWNKKGVVIGCHSKKANEFKQYRDEDFIQISLSYVCLFI